MIGWALRQLLIWGAFAAVAYAVVGYRVFDRGAPTASATAPATSATRAEPARGAAPNSLVYHTDKRGHVVLDGVVNGATVRFLVDTGASFVALTMKDAEAAGISPGSLVFNQPISTGNGVIKTARVQLREIRIGQFSVTDVPAVVHENLNISLLGQTFLKRLDSYEMRDGVLTLNYW